MYSLPVLYPTHQQKTELLISLLSQGAEQFHPGVTYLTSLLLERFTVELQSHTTSATRRSHLRQAAQLNQLVLQRLENEAMAMFDNVNTMDGNSFSRYICQVSGLQPRI